jgi:hypothetical protein
MKTSTLLMLLVTVPLAAQPRITNARVIEQTVSGSLEPAIRQIAGAAADPIWIAYAVPIENPERSMCCWSGLSAEARATWRASEGGCRLEPGSGGNYFNSNRDGRIALDADTFFIFTRVENRRVERVRMFSEDCALDAGGRAVHWLTGVNPAESVAWLASLARADESTNRLVNGALAAMSQHAGPDAIAPLVRLAREAARSKVRGEALFWLAQRAGARASAAITEAIDRDPETDVKKRAVFALSQLPADEGVPRLIDVARNNRNPAVRKQAMFWLGQSKDDRALQFFEEILK